MSSDIPDDLFTGGWKDPENVTLLFNCIKKIEKQITHIFDNTNKLKEKNIKGKSHLQKLSNAVDFITKKFGKYKQELKEREEIMNNFTKNVSRVAQEVDGLSEIVKKQYQYSRRNCLLVDGIPGKEQENTDELCVKALNEH